MAFVVSATQPPNGSLGDEWFNPNTNELKKLVALNGTTVTYATVNVGGTSNNIIANINFTNTVTTTNITYAANVIINATKHQQLLKQLHVIWELPTKIKDLEIRATRLDNENGHLRRLNVLLMERISELQLI